MNGRFARRDLIAGLGALAMPSGLGAQRLWPTRPDPDKVPPRPQTPPGATPGRAAVAEPVIIRQSCPSWCWAASAAMVFAGQGHPVAQEEIVLRLFNLAVCRSGATNDIAFLLNADWTDTRGVPFRAQVTGIYSNRNADHDLPSGRIVEELEAGRPLLYANSRHAMVLIAVDYFLMPGRKAPRIWSATVADPWPENPAIRQLTYNEFIPSFLPGGEAQFLAAVSLAPLPASAPPRAPF